MLVNSDHSYKAVKEKAVHPKVQNLVILRRCFSEDS